MAIENTKNISILKIALEKMYDEIARIEIENVMEETWLQVSLLRLVKL